MQHKPGVPWYRRLRSGTITGPGAVLSFVLIVPVMVVMVFSQLSVEAGEGRLQVTAPLATPITVEYADIDEIRLLSRDEIDFGDRYRGIDNPFIVAATYTNEKYGPYDLYVFRSNRTNYIEIRYKGLVYLVVNLKSPEATADLYRSLMDSAAHSTPQSESTG